MGINLYKIFSIPAELSIKYKILLFSEWILHKIIEYCSNGLIHLTLLTIMIFWAYRVGQACNSKQYDMVLYCWQPKLKILTLNLQYFFSQMDLSSLHLWNCPLPILGISR